MKKYKYIFSLRRGYKNIYMYHRVGARPFGGLFGGNWYRRGVIGREGPRVGEIMAMTRKDLSER